jgi:hypothetical protein
MAVRCWSRDREDGLMQRRSMHVCLVVRRLPSLPLPPGSRGPPLPASWLTSAVASTIEDLGSSSASWGVPPGSAIARSISSFSLAVLGMSPPHSPQKIIRHG